jgi:signal peptidase I
MRNPLDRVTAGLPQPLRVVLDWTVTLGFALAVVLLVKAFVINPYRIPSASMEPTLHCAQPETGCLAGTSDRVLANRFVYHLCDPRRGDLVVFDTPPEALTRCGASGTFVKRLVGLPGETISEQGGVIFVDGKRLAEPYVRPGSRDSQSGRWKVAPGHYFMLGDNRVSSCDSRVWGAVPRENLIGTVFATYWPLTRIALR